MNRNITHSVLAGAAGTVALAVLPAAAHAQYAVTWHAIACGGTTAPVAAGSYTLQSTLGDPLAAPVGSSGQYGLGSGFLVGAGPGGPPPCYANCDGSTTLPVLNVNDFICFQSRFAAADPHADCDQSGTLNVNDFICFQGQFAAGCP